MGRPAGRLAVQREHEASAFTSPRWHQVELRWAWAQVKGRSSGARVYQESALVVAAGADGAVAVSVVGCEEPSDWAIARAKSSLTLHCTPT